jgi:cyclopropane fatty-acyl-phospholipid synthase-like methyltransferase
MRLDPEGAELAALVDLAPELENGRVLEIGCGDGRLTCRYAARARTVVALDPDAAAIDAFRRTMPENLRERIELHTARWEAFDGPPGGFDIAVFSWSL